MSFWESVALAWDSLVQNKLRSILTVLGIIIGVAAVIAVIAIGRGTQSAVVGEIAGLGANSISIYPAAMMEGRGLQRYRPLDEDDIHLLEGLLPDIEHTLRINVRSAVVRTEGASDRVQVIGLSANMSEVMTMTLSEGRLYSPEEDAAAARVVVLGASRAEDFFPNGGAVGQTLYLDGWPYLVVGVLEREQGLLAMLGAGSERDIYVPISTITRDRGRAEYMQLILKVADGASVEAVRRDALEVLRIAHPDAGYGAQSIEQAIEIVQSVTGILTAVISAIAGIALVVGGVGIMNIMLVSVTERTREIGIRKALGARRRDLLLQFMVEAVVICLVGGLIGLALAAVPVWLVGRWAGIPLLVSWDSVVLAVGFSAGVGMLFGVYPASKAAALDPIQALRHE